MISEALFLMDIVLNFFKQGIDEQGFSKFDPLDEIALRYYHSTFVLDVVAFIPWGMLSLVD